MRRRTLLAATATLPAASLLGGCGFALRRPPPLSFERLALVGFAAGSPMEQALRRLMPETVTLVDAPQQAQVVLESLLERRERVVSGTTSFGQVRDMAVRVRFRYRVSTRAGKPLVDPSELLQARDQSYNETLALAKELEQTELYRDMETDIAIQVLRRLETVREI
ncbi:LPS-assembly lipoprotein LptE [Azohydromonas lata]|uniref:LPS-assembly lipoprotein LptE n=1 Tax=Azohydromonas lata TaxID=45677 RepID=UPI001EE4C776|nr:LPS assembly lipoprotein LptE [Azohydromonas lata]